MNKRISSNAVLSVATPDAFEPQLFDDPAGAVDCLEALYERNTRFLCQAFEGLGKAGRPLTRFRACYPQVSIETSSFGHVDSRLSFGYVSAPGVYTTTITRPKLFRHYLKEQLGHLMRNHGVGVTVSESSTPIPLHFAFGEGAHVEPSAAEGIDIPLRDLFDAPDLTQQMAEGGNGYTAFIEPGNITTSAGADRPDADYSLARLPQMPAYHLKKKGHGGITLVNIGVGPSNAKTITDHIAVLRPHVWLMLGHCAGLRNSQRLGDYVLAHAYMREDHVLDDDLPVWIPLPALAEVQVALQDAVAEVTGYKGYDLKQIMRTGTVATIDNRNWELRDQRGPVKRLSQARAIALDMESATIAANGFRFRVPYGTLLCVSDKPLHGELKLPGMASAFYRTQVSQHLKIGILALQKLAAMPSEKLHSRKLRSFYETSFQ
ncbi:AMP nucleosidase [Sinorhizobium medicae]|uniref:AMP nucleosidase n=1 Tax=Sinorhizobium medicae TaxID=110321 RepID=UPI000C7D8788|nr:AMP nucleosidase [Sinorhizobium medicae]PLU02827.1 AMP nucleosidase [Sinorhizobium medicae]